MTRELVPILADRFLAMRPSGIREIVDAAAKHAKAIHLESGQPNFPVPNHVADAAKHAVDEGWNAYTPSGGIPYLRELIANKVTRLNGHSCIADQVVCTTGGTGAIAATFLATLQVGDEVLIPDPAWPIYAMIARLAGAQAVAYPCPASEGFEPDMEALARAITPRTRLLVINSPNNPTGAVYRRAKLQAMLELAVRYGLWVLSDECYDELVFDNVVVSPATLLDDGRVVSVYAFSKTYSMTGWRLGYAVAAPKLVPSLLKAQQCLISCVSSISQKAGEAAMTGPQDVVREMRDAYVRRRDLVVGLLSKAGLLLNVPRGAFYILADVSSTGLDSKQFALDLLEHADVAVSPGRAFGESIPQAVRISLATADDQLQEGVVRLCAFVEHRARARSAERS